MHVLNLAVHLEVVDMQSKPGRGYRTEIKIILHLNHWHTKPGVRKIHRSKRIQNQDIQQTMIHVQEKLPELLSVSAICDHLDQRRVKWSDMRRHVWPFTAQTTFCSWELIGLRNCVINTISGTAEMVGKNQSSVEGLIIKRRRAAVVQLKLTQSHSLLLPVHTHSSLYSRGHTVNTPALLCTCFTQRF